MNRMKKYILFLVAGLLSSLNSLKCQESLMDKGFDAFEAGKLSEAKQIFQSVINDETASDSLVIRGKEKLGLTYFYLQQIDSAAYFIQSAINDADKKKDSALLSRNYAYLSNIYGNVKKEYTKGFTYLDSGIRYTPSNLTKNKIFGLLNKGVMLTNVHLYPEAVDVTLQAIELSENDNSFIDALYSNLGAIYKSTAQIDKAKEAYQKAESLNTLKTKTDSISLGIVWHNLSLLYKEQHKFDSALFYCKKAIDIFKLVQSKRERIAAELVYAGDLCPHVITRNEAYQMLDSLKKEELNLYEKIQLYGLQVKLGDENIDVSKEGVYLQQSDSNKFFELKESLANELYLKYKVMNPTLALYYLEVKNEAKDSVLTSEEAIETYQVEIRKVLNKKEEIIIEQATENETLIYQAKIIEQNRRFWLVVALGSLLILGALVYILNKANKTKKQKLALKQKEVEVEQKEKELVQSKLTRARAIIEEKNKMIGALESENVAPELAEQLIKKINTNKEWAQFMVEFEMLYRGFFQKMQKATENKLTQNDLRLASLIKLNLTNQEMADILYISSDSVKKAKQRFAKKMEMENAESLVDFILKA